MKDTLEKAEALERHVKTVTMLAEMLTSSRRSSTDKKSPELLEPAVSTAEHGGPSSQSRTKSRLNVSGAVLWRCRSQHSHPYQTVESRESIFPSLRAVCVNSLPKMVPLERVLEGPLWSRNSTDARDGASVERCLRLRAILRAVLLVDEA